MHHVFVLTKNQTVFLTGLFVIVYLIISREFFDVNMFFMKNSVDLSGVYVVNKRNDGTCVPPFHG